MLTPLEKTFTIDNESLIPAVFKCTLVSKGRVELGTVRADGMFYSLLFLSYLSSCLLCSFPLLFLFIPPLLSLPSSPSPPLLPYQMSEKPVFAVEPSSGSVSPQSSQVVMVTAYVNDCLRSASHHRHSTLEPNPA